MVQRLAIGLLCVGVLCWAFAFGSWAIGDQDAVQNTQIAVNDQRIAQVERRVQAIEDRMFQILMATGGALLGSAASAFFALLTHRRIKANGTQS